MSINPRRVDINKSTPLHFAALSGHLKNVQSLIKLGSKVNARDGDGNTALHLAVFELIEAVQVPVEEEFE